MTLSMRIAPHLPYLRRFSRAANLSAAVRSLLSSIVIIPSDQPQIGLFPAFIRSIIMAAPD